jgi:hypothetical protein
MYPEKNKILSNLHLRPWLKLGLRCAVSNLGIGPARRNCHVLNTLINTGRMLQLCCQPDRCHECSVHFNYDLRAVSLQGLPEGGMSSSLTQFRRQAQRKAALKVSLALK